MVGQGGYVLGGMVRLLMMHMERLPDHERERAMGERARLAWPVATSSTPHAHALVQGGRDAGALQNRHPPHGRPRLGALRRRLTVRSNPKLVDVYLMECHCWCSLYGVIVAGCTAMRAQKDPAIARSSDRQDSLKATCMGSMQLLTG